MDDRSQRVSRNLEDWKSGCLAGERRRRRMSWVCGPYKCLGRLNPWLAGKRVAATSFSHLRVGKHGKCSSFRLTVPPTWGPARTAATADSLRETMEEQTPLLQGFREGKGGRRGTGDPVKLRTNREQPSAYPLQKR